MTRRYLTFALAISLTFAASDASAQKGKRVPNSPRSPSFRPPQINSGGGSRSPSRPSGSRSPSTSSSSRGSRSPSTSGSTRSAPPSRRPGNQWTTPSRPGGSSRSRSSRQIIAPPILPGRSSISRRYDDDDDSRSRYSRGGTSFGLSIGGLSIGRSPYLYNRYGGYGYTPYGYSRGYDYGYDNYYYGQQPVYPVPSQNYGTVTVIPDIGVSQPVLSVPPSLPSTAGIPSTSIPYSPSQSMDYAGTNTGLPRNTLPSVSVVTNEIPNIALPGKAVLFNPAQSGGPVRYVLNDRPYVIRPGEAQRIDLAQDWTIEFDRGMNGDVDSQTLTEGVHKFGVGRLGWQLTREQPTATKRNEPEVQLPAPPMPVEALENNIPPLAAPPAASDLESEEIRVPQVKRLETEVLNVP